MAVERSVDDRIDAQIGDAMSGFHAAFANVRQSLDGAGHTTRQAFDHVTSRATRMIAAADVARDRMRQIAADQSKPQDYRRQMVRDLHAAATDALNREHQELAQRIVPTLARLLAEGGLPSPSKDPNDRMLRRQELSTVLNGKQGPALLEAASKLIGQNASWDAEALSDFGQALFAANGLDKEWPQFRQGAAMKLLNSPNGTERQLAFRKALAAFAKGNVPGAVTGLHAIAKHRLGDRPS